MQLGERSGLQNIYERLGFAPGEVLIMKEYSYPKESTKNKGRRLIRKDVCEFVSENKHYAVFKFKNYRESFTRKDIGLKVVEFQRAKK